MTEGDIFERPSRYIEWKLVNFTEVPTEVGYCIESPRFSLSGAKWFLKIYPNGIKINDLSVGRITLYLCKEEDALKYSVTLRLGIKKADDSEFNTRQETAVFGENKFFEMGYLMVERTTIHNSKPSFIPDGNLRVFCFLQIESQRLVSSNMDTASQTLLLDFDPVLVEDFGKMYIKGHYTDVTILVKNKKFRAHRNVLAARSSVFDSMFQHEFAEKSSGNVEITDCDPDSFEEFLFFLYTGKLNNLSPSKAVDLYRTADKYDVKKLKEKCVDIMRHDLCVDSFCDVIHLAKMHLESDLQKAATDFFIEHVENILSTAKWFQFSEENIILSSELILKFVKSKK